MKLLSWATVIVLVIISIDYINTKFSKDEYYKTIVVTADSNSDKDSINIIFSQSGGIHFLEEVVKARLKAPEYYQHIKTQWEQTNISNVRVWMTYRTKTNSKNQVQADVRLTGQSPRPNDINNIEFINVQKQDYK